MTTKAVEGFDKSQTMLAGEFLTLGQLIKRGYQASVTFGNSKSVDILAFNPRTDRSFAVQVKALRQPNCFPLKKERVSPDHIYVFVILQEGDKPERFYIMSGAELLSNVNHYWGSSYINNQAMPAVNYGPLKPFFNNWSEFEK